MTIDLDAFITRSSKGVLIFPFLKFSGGSRERDDVLIGDKVAIVSTLIQFLNIVQITFDGRIKFKQTGVSLCLSGGRQIWKKNDKFFFFFFFFEIKKKKKKEKKRIKKRKKKGKEKYP